MKINSQKIIRARLAGIEGQLRGLIQMIEEDCDSEEMLTQLSAVLLALDSVGTIVISDHVEELAGPAELSPETHASLSAMIRSFLK